MRIEVIKLGENGAELLLEEAVDRFSGLLDASAYQDVAFPAPVRVKAHIFPVGEMVEVQGVVETSVALCCSRCSADFDYSLSEEFSLTYSKELPEVTSDDFDEDEGLELSAEDMGILLYEGDEIDLHEGIEEQVLMGVPLKPLCSEDCKGLCPSCGVDLNVESCSCGPASPSLKFAALKDFKIKKS